MADNIFTKIVDAVIEKPVSEPVNYVYPGDVRSEASVEEK